MRVEGRSHVAELVRVEEDARRQPRHHLRRGSAAVRRVGGAVGGVGRWAHGGVASSTRMLGRTSWACPGCTQSTGRTYALRTASRTAATRCPGGCGGSAPLAASGGRRLFMSYGRPRASAAARLGQTMPRAPMDTAAPSRAPRVAPFRKLRAASRSSARSAKACSTRIFRFAAAPGQVGPRCDGASSAPIGSVSREPQLERP